MSELEEIEAAILAHCNERWQKFAKIIIDATEKRRAIVRSSLIWGPLGSDEEDQVCEAHIDAIEKLIEKGKLEARGHPSWPRHSEIRLIDG